MQPVETTQATPIPSQSSEEVPKVAVQPAAVVPQTVSGVVPGVSGVVPGVSGVVPGVGAAAAAAASQSITKTFNIHVSHLPLDAQDVDLALAFQGFGEIRLARVIRDTVSGKSKGYGFVNFGAEDARHAAMTSENLEVKGSPVSVELQKGRDPNQPSPGGDEDVRKTLYVGNIPKEFSKTDLWNEIGQYGTFVDLLRPKEHFCFVQYATFEDAELAFSKLRNQAMNGLRLTVQFAKNKNEKERDQSSEHKLEKAARTVYINNLPETIDQAALKKKFDLYGEIQRVTVVSDSDGNSKGFGFVEFVRAADAQEAQRVLNGTPLEGKVLTVEMSRPRLTSDRRDRDDEPATVSQPQPWGMGPGPFGMMTWDNPSGQYVFVPQDQPSVDQFGGGSHRGYTPSYEQVRAQQPSTSTASIASAGQQDPSASNRRYGGGGSSAYQTTTTQQPQQSHSGYGPQHGTQYGSDRGSSSGSTRTSRFQPY